MPTVEIDGPANECLYFRPLQRRLRGRLDLMRDTEPLAKITASEQVPIPGLRVGFDGVGFIEEPLHDGEHKAVRQFVEKQGYAIGPEREEFEGESEATWVYWLMRAVQSGVARVVAGKLPAKLPSDARTDFLNPPMHDERDKLTTAIENQTKVMAKLLEKLG